MTRVDHQAVVVGAGPAGLATSRELRRREIEHVVLERGDSVAHPWRTLYDSLRLHTGKHMSALPGMRFPAAVPLFPSRGEFLDYLEGYVERFQLPVETSCRVTRAEPHAGGWRVGTERGDLTARAVVGATGILSNPYVPEFAGRERFKGRVIHSVEYRRPESSVNRRVLVVGVGNSSGEISSELARSGVRVTIAVRSGAIALPRQFLGIPIQYFSCLMSWLPRPAQRTLMAATARISQLWRGRPVLPRPELSPCPDVPLIGFQLFDAIRERRIQVKGTIDRFTEDGVRFGDGSEEQFDQVILATGYRAAIGWLEGIAWPDDCGFARRERRVRSADQPGLYFVGHNYDARGGLVNIAQDARLAGRYIASQLS